MSERETVADFFGRNLQADGVADQLRILRACQHVDVMRCGVRVSATELLDVCLPCIHAGREAFDAGRKAYLAAWWHSQASVQSTAMKDCQVDIGMRVQRFCPSMLGFGGVTLTGTVTRNRNGMAVVRMDAKCSGRRFDTWNRGWRPEVKP